MKATWRTWQTLNSLFKFDFKTSHFLIFVFVSVEARIEENETTLIAMQNQIRAHFKMALMQIPRKVRSLKFEQLIQEGKEPRLSDQVCFFDSDKLVRLEAVFLDYWNLSESSYLFHIPV